MIPKRLHFTWKTEQLPRPMQAYYDAWRRLHPDWDIRLWTDESMRAFVAEAYPSFLPTYDGYPKMIQRADAFRYLVLGRLGGIYADLDVEPLGPVTPLLDHAAFMGIEPLEHIFPDRHHQGVPFLLTNAFMGSVPGHALWSEIIALMPDLLEQETFYSTGPSMVTAAVLRLEREARPTLLAPSVWSPLLADGRRTRRNEEAIRLLAPIGEIDPARATLVSHKWMTTWVAWHKRGSRIAPVLQLPTRGKWALRRLRYPALAQTIIPDPLQLYTDQNFQPAVPQPPVQIALVLRDRPLDPSLATALAGLDYPRSRLAIAIHASAGRGETALSVLDAAGFVGARVVEASQVGGMAIANGILDMFEPEVEHVLLVDGAVRDIPPEALAVMLGTGRPIVSANVLDTAGRPADPALFRYEKGAPFKVLYKDGGRSGTVDRSPTFRTTLEAQKAFRILPVDGVGDSFVLVGREVAEAGVRFAETPYKLHLGAEAFGIMARDRGFEACGLPNLRVVRSA